MVVIGGLGSVPGALLGALFVRGVTWWLPVEWQILATGAGHARRAARVPRRARRRVRRPPRRRSSGGSARRVAASRAPALTGRPPCRRRPSSDARRSCVAATGRRRRALAGARARRRVRRRARCSPASTSTSRAGEIVALLGTNGSGKSTLLARGRPACVRRADGRVTIDGRDTTRTRAERRRRARRRRRRRAATGCSRRSRSREHLRLATLARARPHGAPTATSREALDAVPGARRHGPHEHGRRPLGRRAAACSRSRWRWSARPDCCSSTSCRSGSRPRSTERVVDAPAASCATPGTTVVVVEQSLDLARRARRPRVLPRPRRRPLRGRAGRTCSSARPRPRRVPRRHGRDRRPSPRRTAESPRPTRGAAARASTGSASASAASSRSTTCRFTVARGEIVGCDRANGAGKTTLFDVLSGFVPPTPARSRSGPGDGPVIDARRTCPPYRRARARPRPLVPGRSAVPRAHRPRDDRGRAANMPCACRDPVAAALHLPAVARSEAAVRAPRRRARRRCSRLGAYADRVRHELSTGTRRIVDLACVLAHEPSVLLLDEPSSGLAQREAEALAPLLVDVRDSLGDQPARGRARPRRCSATSPTAWSPSTSAGSSPPGDPDAVLARPRRGPVVPGLLTPP